VETRYYVPHRGKVPQDVVEIVSRTAVEVRFFPAGGGLQSRLPASRFDELYRAVGRAEYSWPEAYTATYDIEGMFGAVRGYSFGHRWNGWARPYFPAESCDRIISQISGARYDPAQDAYLIPSGDGNDPEEVDVYPSRSIRVGQKEIRVWGIGSGSWTWEEVPLGPPPPVGQSWD
jgi:hypothetical protein